MFDKRSLDMVTTALRRHSDKVNLNATWRRLHQHYGIGTVLGQSALQLSEADHRTLLALLEKDMNLKALQQSAHALEGNRMMLAATVKNEKLSRVAVSGDLVLVASVSGELTLPSGIYSHPFGGALQTPAGELHGLQQVVLVENLSVLYSLQRYRWPEAVRNLPMLFRGSPQHTPAAVSNALSQVKEVICFPDYDPQGLMNSLTQHHACALIVPAAATIERLLEAGLDKPADFARQHSARDWLRPRQLPVGLRQMLDQEIALSQESMADMELNIVQLEGLG